MLDLAETLQARRVEIAHVQYYGWAYLNRAALMPTRRQLEEATAVVEAARERLKGVLVIDYVVPDYYARRPKSCMGGWGRQFLRSEEHTSELQSLMRISYAVFCLKKKTLTTTLS